MKTTENNVLFLLIDALRADKCLGIRKTAKTPTINSLCKKGTVFTQAIAATSTTTPSVASILTGTYPPSHGIRSLMGYKLNLGVKTLAEIFRENGYNTYAEVTGPLLPETGLNKGFDEYNCREEADDVYSEWGEHLVKKFENEDFKQPSFIFIHFFELHQPRVVPKEFDNDNFGRNRYERAISALDAYLKRLLANVGDDVVLVLHADHGEKIVETRVEEFILKVKKGVWRVMRRVGLEKDNTLKAVGHGFHVYDYLIRVPLVFVGDGIFPEGKIVHDQVGQVDVLPTLIEALKLDVHCELEIDGRSLLPLVRGQQMQEIPVFCEACGATLPDRSTWLEGIRTPKFKFVYGPYSDKIHEELYDLEKDPNETQNVLRKNPQIAQKLKEILRSSYEKIGERKHVPYTPGEEEKIKERLRRLGYL